MRTIRAAIPETNGETKVEVVGARITFYSRKSDSDKLGRFLLRNAVLVLSAAVVFCLGMVGASARADEGGADARAIRLSNVDGDVQVVQDGQVIANPAFANLPMFQGSQVITGNEGRAEIQLDDGGSVVRLSPNTTLTFSVLQLRGSGTNTEIVVNGGLAYFEVRPTNSEHSLRINYGLASISATSFSVIRINMDAAPGELAVLSGNVHLERGNLQLDIHGGESLSLSPNDGSGYNISETIEPDSWDSWNADRDQVLNAESAQKTAAASSLSNYQNVGMSDLDANGNWYDVPGQGYVWSPYDAQSYGAGWDPYGFGHWVFYPRYGYVWVSGYGWGYTPYQCGLWNFYDNFGWGWAPGGSCYPWWRGGGFYGGGGGYYNIATFPRGYRPPRRPVAGPHPVEGPRPGSHVAGEGVVRTGLNPIPIDRRPVSTPQAPGAGRTGQPVTISGYTVEPLRPIAPRQTYDRSTTSFVNRSAPSSQPGQFVGGSHPAYTPNPGRVSPGSGQQMPAYRPPSQPASRPSAPPASRAPSYSGGGGGSAPHSAPAPAPASHK